MKLYWTSVNGLSYFPPAASELCGSLLTPPAPSPCVLISQTRRGLNQSLAADAATLSWDTEKTKLCLAAAPTFTSVHTWTERKTCPRWVTVVFTSVHSLICASIEPVAVSSCDVIAACSYSCVLSPSATSCGCTCCTGAETPPEI